jgi:heme exporter protein D
MGCLAILLNAFLPGLGTLCFTNKRGQGFTQLVLSVANGIVGIVLTALTVGLWFFVWFIIHIGLAAWALASTISFMSEQSAKKAIQEERDRQERLNSSNDAL